MPKILKTIFSTCDFHANEKYDAFVDSIGTVFEVDKLSSSLKDFSAKITSHLIGEIMFVRCDTKGQEFLRSSHKIANDGIDHYLVQLFRKGGTFNLVNVSFGDENHIVVIDASKPWRAKNKDFDVITLVLPRRILSPKLLAPDGHHGRTISFGTPLGKLLADYILSLYQNLDQLDPGEAMALLSPTVDLVALTLNSFEAKSFAQTIFDDKSLEDQTTREVIKRFIDINLHHTDLNLEFISSGLKKSRADLYRNFQIDGGIATYIRDRRLTVAHRRVTQTSSSIGKIAHSVGFSSESVFTRSFKKKFGLNPSETRKKAMIEALHRDTKSDTSKWESWLQAL